MAKQIINIGTLPNDQTGDPLRIAFNKVNQNFTELYKVNSGIIGATSTGNTAGQVVMTFLASSFTQGTFQINTTDAVSGQTQNVTLAGVKNVAGNAVSFTTYGQMTDGSVLTSHSMDINNGNIRILTSPQTTANLTHFVMYRYSSTGDLV